MLIADAKDDAFQDSILRGVKELFEASENELLPIVNQLKRFKKRDLRASHVHRTSRKVFGAQKPLWRHHIVEDNPFERLSPGTDRAKHGHDDTSFPCVDVLPNKVDKPKNSQEIDDEKIASQITTHWINERKKLRDELNKLEQIETWLARKEDKTCLEEKVLLQLKRDSSTSKAAVSLSRDIKDSVPNQKEPSLTQSMMKIAEVIARDKSLLSGFSKYKTSSDFITRKEFFNDLALMQDSLKLSAKEKESLYQFYVNRSTEEKSFYTALLNSIRLVESSSNTPQITLTPCSENEEKQPPVFLLAEAQLNKEVPQFSHAEAKDSQRNARLTQYQKTAERCKEREVSISESHLRKVMLHPEDQLRDDKKPIVRVSDGNLLSENFWKVRERKRYRRRRRRESVISSESPESSETESKISRSPDTRSFIILPPLRDVAPEKHHMNLSTGRALVGRKVDCWLSAEEYGRITSNPVGVPLERERSNPNAFWPGHPLDKSRIWMTPCGSHPYPPCDGARSKKTVFQRVGVLPHNGKKSNYGYNNNELTWPTDGKYIKYGDIELNKVYII